MGMAVENRSRMKTGTIYESDVACKPENAVYLPFYPCNKRKRISNVGKDCSRFIVEPLQAEPRTM
jgi:hypothetical protein